MGDFSTLGIFAHANAGKTTITEHLLYNMGTISKIGRVDSGNTVTDSMSIERERGISVKASVVSFELGNRTIHLIDTPGHVDFSAEVERSISILDGAVLVISGVGGLEAQTYMIWNALMKKKVPVVIFVNKMDRAGADYSRVIRQLKTLLPAKIITLKQIHHNQDGTFEPEDSSIENLVEELSLVDECLLQRYVQGQEITDEYIKTRVKILAQSGKMYPIIGGSALSGIGIIDLIDCINECLPSYKKMDNEPFSAFVYSLKEDGSGKNAYIKVLSGSLSTRDSICTSTGTMKKVKKISVHIGAQLAPTDSISSGELAVIGGLDVRCGQLIGEEYEFNEYVAFVRPLLSMEVIPCEQGNVIRIMEALKILNEEDPYLNLTYNENTHSIYVSLMGDLQSQIIESQLYERFGVKVRLENPTVIHKEVPMITARAKATYTTVSGIEIEVKPLDTGSGFVFKSKVSSDFLHIKYQRQAERLIRYYSKQGLYGWELTDIEVSIVGGQFDSMGSDPMHFNIITPLALFRCLKQANIKVMEPVSKYTIIAPEQYLNYIVKSLSNKKSVFDVNKTSNSMVTIEGEAPLSVMLEYSIELSKITSGRGSLSTVLSRYAMSLNQGTEKVYVGPDPRNEVRFVINDMKASLEPLDKTLMKKKKESRSKFRRRQREKRV